jgi:catalase
VSTADEFAVFLRALGASGPGVPSPTPVETFLSTHPGAQNFLATRSYPASYATAAYFGVNSLKFTNAAGKSSYVRYKFVPRAEERYLTPDQRKAEGKDYLQDEIVERVGKASIVFDWYAQVAQRGDKIEDPSIAWPDTRRLVKLGTITLTRRPADEPTAQKALLFLPGQPHPGVEPADPMLILRNSAYPISLGQRQ